MRWPRFPRRREPLFDDQPTGGLTYAQFSAALDAVEADGRKPYEAPKLVIQCERCGRHPAVSHDVEGWLCEPCGDELYPRYEG